MSEIQAEGGEGGEEVAQPSDSEREAMNLGWEAQDKWHGKADDWVDADTFLRRGREINSVLKKTLKTKDAQLASMQAQMDSLKGTVAELAQFRAKTTKDIQDGTMNALKGQLKQARVDGDVERQVDVEEAIDRLKEEIKSAPTPTTVVAPVSEPPEFVAWKDRNDWYGKPNNSKMTNYADGVAMNTIQQLQRQGIKPEPNHVLKVVDDAVRDMFPQEFSSAPRTSMVEGGGNSGGGSSSGAGKKGFSSLPAEAKAQFNRFYEAGYYIDMKTKKPLPKGDAQAEYFKDYE